MQIQQDLKLDQIKASKTNKMEDDINVLMDQGNMSRKEALNTYLKEPVNSTAAFEKWNAATKDLTAAVRVGVEFAVSEKEFDAPVGIIDSKKYKTGKEFLETNPEAGNYVFKGRVINISDEGVAKTIKTFYRSKKDDSWLSGFFGSKDEAIG